MRKIISHQPLAISRKTVACFLLSVCCLLTATAQDIHFSQYNSSPLTLNPALTGFYAGDYRLIANYRSQWGSFTDPYRTLAASFEASLLKGKLKDDNLGIGLQFFNDQAGTIELGTNYIGLSCGYRKALGYYRKNALSFGLQVGMLKQRLNGDNLIFDSQYNGVTADPSQLSGESVNSTTKPGFDLGVGLLFHSAPTESFNFYLGGSYYHILEPNITFLSGSDYKLNAKYVGHFGMQIEMTRLLNLLPSAVYYQQGRARQINAGTYLQFILDDDNYESLTAFSIGAWARVADPLPDAVIIGARMDYWNFVLSMSYDVNVSNLRTASESRGAYEISFIYIGKITTRGQRNLTMPCPQL